MTLTKTQALNLANAKVGRDCVRRDEPHWYFIYRDSGCVLCGAGGDERVRVRGTKPKDYRDREDWAGDHACDGHFM